MAARDIKVVRKYFGDDVFNVDDRTGTVPATGLSIKPGEPCIKVITSNTAYATPATNGAAVPGTDILLGIAKENSTESVTVDGTVRLDIVGPGSLLMGKATNSANMNTAALLNGILYDYVTFDLTGTVYTIDEDEGNNVDTHSLFILSGDTAKGTLNVLVSSVSIFDAATD